MKKLFIIAIIGTSLVFQSCNTKENKEKTVTTTDSIVTETVVIDSVTTENGTQVVVEEIATEVVTTTTEKPTTVTKVSVKEPVKVVTPTKTVTKVSEPTKTEAATKVVVADQPKKVVVAETPVKVAVQEPKVTASASSWVVPSKYQSMKNPTDPKVDLAIGKSLYGKHCKSCHGSEGYGDGVKAKDMKGDLGDFSSKKFQSHTDGGLFYKTTFGKNDMPAFSKKLPSDEDRWLIVNYMRTL